MSERKIILEEILHSKSDTKTLSEEFVYHEFQIIQAMKEACKQVLELAAENAKTSHDYYDKWDENEAYNKHKDFGFERCDGDGIPYGVDVITINKQSIIDTINQVE